MWKFIILHLAKKESSSPFGIAKKVLFLIYYMHFGEGVYKTHVNKIQSAL